jgi:hypothetical protein
VSKHQRPVGKATVSTCKDFLLNYRFYPISIDWSHLLLFNQTLRVATWKFTSGDDQYWFCIADVVLILFTLMYPVCHVTEEGRPQFCSSKMNCHLSVLFLSARIGTRRDGGISRVRHLRDKKYKLKIRIFSLIDAFVFGLLVGQNSSVCWFYNAETSVVFTLNKLNLSSFNSVKMELLWLVKFFAIQKCVLWWLVIYSRSLAQSENLAFTFLKVPLQLYESHLVEELCNALYFYLSHQGRLMSFDSCLEILLCQV